MVRDLYGGDSVTSVEAPILSVGGTGGGLLNTASQDSKTEPRKQPVGGVSTLTLRHDGALAFADRAGIAPVAPQCLCYVVVLHPGEG